MVFDSSKFIRISFIFLYPLMTLNFNKFISELTNGIHKFQSQHVKTSYLFLFVLSFQKLTQHKPVLQNCTYFKDFDSKRRKLNCFCFHLFILTI
jgi:hypothetical protein